MTKATFKHGLAARRYLTQQALSMLGEAALREENHKRVFLQAYRWGHSLALPSLQANPEVQTRAAELRAASDLDPGQYGGIQEPRWGRVCWWMEAWFRDGVFGADAKGEQVSAKDVLEDDPEKASHYYARTAYRKAVVNATTEMADVMTTAEPNQANWLFDQCYPYLFAVAFPVVQRLPGVQAELRDLWADGVPGDKTQARKRRLDTQSLLIRAWTRSAVLSEPKVPKDTSSREDLLEAVQDPDVP